MKNYFNQLLFCKKNFRTILTLCWFDIIMIYRRTFFGPMWTVFTIMVTTAILSLVWSTLFKVDLAIYLPRLFFSLTIWAFIVASLTEGSSILTGKYGEALNNSPIPVMFYSIRHTIKNIILYLHNIPIIILFYFVFDIKINSYQLIYFLSLVLIILNCAWMTTFFSIIASRFRDLIPFLKTMMSSATLFTPIFWDKYMLGEYVNYVYLNPLTYFIEAIQYPMLGQNPGYLPFIGLFVFLIIGNILVYFLLKFKGNQVAFWSK